MITGASGFAAEFADMTLGFATWLGDAISVGRFGEEGSALVLEYPNWHEAKSSSARQHGEEWISFMSI
jgi:hypothetical protein